MKKYLFLLVIFAVITMLAACGSDENNGKEETTGNDTNKNQEEQKEVVEDSEQNPEEDQNKQEENSEEQKIYENDSFKDVEVNKSGDKVVVTGKARVFEGVFNYSIISDGEVLKKDTYQTDGAPAWGEFEISFDKELIKEKTTFKLFFLSAKNGTKTDVLEIPLNENLK
ncbi:Gmad2 immunoglobulin-like domain-containing protein [Virgibacillus sp. DJP39]|uniref:Gmad2 immunoglobulin-like domain-containing protein n=1 Tax=Virgibacillus sp. DJP39 TaxID=3409790 RepID=UPI003BB57A78